MKFTFLNTGEGLPGTEVAMMSLGDKPVYLCCGHTDMRKSINGFFKIGRDKQGQGKAYFRQSALSGIKRGNSREKR